MFNIVLIEPEIPQNTGNIARTCATTHTKLHLVRPLGFEVSDKHLKRAGLDYWRFADISYYDSFRQLQQTHPQAKFWYLTTKAKKRYTNVKFERGCFLVFGKETKGLPEELLHSNYDRCIRIPMYENLRSLNLSNSVAIVLYEALRQYNFDGLI
ncbi:MAG TPA: tRNA (uridine(34)/cytosine(34)/5-carboxymethylaminomethyluridine(34)-2'-O)-methyltransferase TrmL [Clostridiales bacterium]|nr:tRNA (uridine(34)/cytosine(34)/5-carboxymethylaminomethyluridine(34)-2'-O)-methyltransferase TrmL [Clostridiales bacterium]